MEARDIRNEDVVAVLNGEPSLRGPEPIEPTKPESETPAENVGGPAANTPPEGTKPPEEDGSGDGDEPAPEPEGEGNEPTAKAKTPKTEEETRKADWSGITDVEFVPSIWANSPLLGMKFSNVSHVIGLHGRRISEFREICRQGDLPCKIAVTLFGTHSTFLYVAPQGGKFQPLLDLFADEGWTCGKDVDFEVLPRTEPENKSGIAYGGTYGVVAVPIGFRDQKVEVSLRFDPQRPRLQPIVLADFRLEDDDKGLPRFGFGDETRYESVADFLAKNAKLESAVAGAGRRALQVFFYKTCVSKVDDDSDLLTRAVRKNDQGQILLLSVKRHRQSGLLDSAQAVWYIATMQGVRREGPVIRLQTRGSEVRPDAEIGDVSEVVSQMLADYEWITARGKPNGVKVNGADQKANGSGSNEGWRAELDKVEKNGRNNRRDKHPNDKFGGKKNRTDADDADAEE